MTSCIQAPALNGARLLQALDGAADAATAAHLDACPHCRQALERLRREELRLHGLLAQGPCPSRESLAAWADGDLGAAEAAVVDAHAGGCASCRADLAELTAFRQAALEVADQMDGALAALRPARRTPPQEESGGPLRGLRRLVATLQAPQALPTALRARGAATAAASSYSADEGRIIVSCVLRPGAASGRYRLSGRLHGLDLAEVEARDAAGQPLAKAGLDAHGGFQLPDLPAGPTWLRFAGRGQVLELDRPMDLGPGD